MVCCLNFSPTEYIGRKLHKSFEAQGLDSRMITISNGSTMHCWVPKGFTPPNGNGATMEGLTDGRPVSAAIEKPVLVLLHGFGGSAIWQWSSQDDQELCKRAGAATIPELLLPTTRPGFEAVGKLVFSKPPPTWFIPSFLINDHLNVLYLPNREEKVGLMQNLAFGKETAPALLTKVEKDVLIIWGEADKIFPLDPADRIKEYLRKRAELVVLKDAGHVSHMEQPVKWNSHVVKFLFGIELS